MHIQTIATTPAITPSIINSYSSFPPLPVSITTYATSTLYLTQPNILVAASVGFVIQGVICGVSNVTVDNGGALTLGNTGKTCPTTTQTTTPTGEYDFTTVIVYRTGSMAR